MTYIMIILISLSLFCFVKSYCNRRVLTLTVMLWSLIGMIFSLFFIISITSNYNTLGYIFGSFDRNMFINIVKNRLNYFTIIRVFNICISVYLVTMSLFAYSYIKSRNKKIKIYMVFATFLFPVFYALFYDPKILMFQHTAAVKYKNGIFVLRALDLMLHTAVYFYLLVPFLRLYKARRSISSIYKKRQLAGVAFYLVVTDIIYLYIIRMSALRTLYIKLDSALINIRPSSTFSKDYLVYVTLILILILMLFYISSSFNIIRKEGFFYNKITDKIIKKSNRHILQTVHSFKNVLYSYSLALEQIQSADGEEKESLTNKLKNDIDSYLERLISVLNIGKGINDFWTDKVYLSDIVEDAVSSLKIPDGIDLVKNYEPKTEIIYADSYYLTEAICNILQNAVQAIEESCRSDGVITVSIIQEYEWIVLAVSDNGVGMKRKQMRHIFDEFYTTKTRVLNWGVGLAFSKRIVQYHHGNISVKSKAGAGTTFYVLLPDDFEA